MTKYNTYYKSDYQRLKHKFKGSDTIERNYSQAFQDLFVLSLLNGKKSGYYIEIGGDHPVNINNSLLLEAQFNWKGLSFEIDSIKVDYYNNVRLNPCICLDATKADYKQIFEEHQVPKRIDYLQIDIEPSYQTLNALKQLPLDEYRFSVITFETDLYKDGPEAANECDRILTEHEYELIIKNVANEGYPYENWYADPTVISKTIINKFKQVLDEPKEAINCLLQG